MNRLFTQIFFVTALLASVAFTAQATCPTNASTVIEVCNDAGGNGTIRAYFYNGDPAISYYLFSLTTGQYAGPAPLGPVTVNTSIPLPAGAKAGVEFGLVPDGNYVIYVNCSPSGNVNIGGMGITVNSAEAVVVNATVDPDCNPGVAAGNADGSIVLDIAGGVAPYDITWPTFVTAISDINNAPAGNHTFANLDGGNYTANIRDANNCVFTLNIAVPLVTTPNAGADQTVCGPTANLSANAAAPSEIGTWSGPAGIIFFPDANTRNAVVSNLAVGVNTLTWTITDTNGLCAGVSDQVDITSNATPTVEAGPAQSLCTGASALLAGTIGGSATSATWTSSGDGTFDNASSLTATYSPGTADMSGGTVTLTLTTNDPAGPCVAISDNVVITINAAVSVEAGPAQMICSNTSATLAGSFGDGASSATWTTSGDGSFSDASSPTAAYTPGPNDVVNSTVTLTFTTNDPAGPCLPASDDVVITIEAAPTVEAGIAQTICSGGTVVLSAARGGSATSSVWTTSGDGTFDDVTSLNAVYTPGSGDISAKLVTLTITTNDPAGPCLPVQDDVVITIDAAATAEAGAIQTICAGEDITLAGSFGGSATGVVWTSSGDGSFVDNTLTNAVYSPGPTDLSTGSVTLTITTNDPAGPCVSATDNVIVTINAPATANAGTDQTICAGSTVALTGIAGGSAASGTWSTTGDGTFDNASSSSAIYTPGTADIGAKTVTLTFTTNDPAGPCGPAMDDVIISINEGATADAGAAQTICEDGSATLAAIAGGSVANGTWATAGDGVFNDNTSLNAIYTPGPNDVLNKSVTLTFTTEDPTGPCPSASDNVIITIDALPLVDAGSAQTICSGSSATLSGSISGSATSALWTTAGDGTFNDAALLNAVYTPGPLDAGSGVTLTLTTNDPAGPCTASSANVVITINAGATVSAGGDQTICADGTATLAGSFAGAATTASWSTSGDGTFDNNTSVNAVYTPGPGDIANKTATLTFTTDDPSGPCGPVKDELIITINSIATAMAGADQTLCAGETISLSGSVGGSASAGIWTTAGDGTFNDATSLTAIYTPGSADLAAGTVDLTLTSNDPAGPCGVATSLVTINFEDPAVAEAGNAQIICSGGTATLTGSSVSGAAATGAWSIFGQPSGGNGVLSNMSQTGSPEVVTFTASVAGDYTLRLTTNDPVGNCGPVTDDVIITVSAVATVDAGAAQTICYNGTATLAATFAGSTGITWTSAGDGTFNDASLPGAVYTPGPNDISNETVILTVTTAGPCASVVDNVTITITPASTVDAGAAQIICSSAGIVLNATFGGSATGLLWTTSGDGTFDDNTDPNAQYAPGPNDASNGTATLTATATGSCAGATDNVIITINPAATVDAGNPQTVCEGSPVTLDATLGGSATVINWTTSGDGTFSDNTNPDAVYTPGSNDLASGAVTLTATTNNPAGPCPAANDNVVITLKPIPGDQITAGNETWIGYAYDDTGDISAIDTRINFANAKYRGFIEATDIDNMTAASTYDVTTDAFDLNLGLTDVIQGPNVCGTLLENFSIRYKMNKTLTEGIYRFTIGADDGIRLLIDGVNVIPATAFDFQSYTEFTTDPLCLSAGVHSFEIHYFENTAYSRLNFNYEQVPVVITNSPVEVCVNSASPTLTVSSTDAAVLDFNWYKNNTLVFAGANYVPAASELDMTTAGNVTFQVSAVYSCGETQPVDVVVSILNTATLALTHPTICESGGTVDLKNFVTPTPGGGTFVFAGHPKISGDTFDPTGLAGTTIAITVDYSTASCTAAQQTLNVTVTNTATTTVPTAAVAACESAGNIDLTTLVSATPAGGTFTFAGTQVTGNLFDPSGLSGVQMITVDYSVGGCAASQATFSIDVATAADLTTTNANACQNGPMVNLLSLVSATPAGGVYTFSGAGVIGNSFDPSGQSGIVNIGVSYDLGGCTDNATLQITVLNASDPLCTGGNCSSVVIVPMPEPATCTNSDGRLVMNITPFTPAVNNTGVKITIDGVSSTNLPISRTIFNENTFENLPVGQYDYVIEYGDPGCIKTGKFSIDQSGTVGTPVASSIVSPQCAGSATGSLILDVPGETGNILEWSLDGGLTDPFKPFTAGGQITGIPAGAAPAFQQVISVRRNASDVCYSSVTIPMSESVTSVSATFGVNAASCNGNDGAITGITPGGGHGGPYTFSIDGGQSFQSASDFSGLAGGSYVLRVRDGVGCERDFAANITFPGFVNSAITKSNADCSNDGNSGSITVVINDPGVFQVALSTDQFTTPADADFINYASPSVSFAQLPRGEYFVYIRSGSAACPTRSAPINIFGAYDVSFALQSQCNDNALSLALVNVTGEAGGAPLEIRISKKMSTDAPVILSMPLPSDGEIFLDYNQHAFLRTPGEYRIQISQPQSETSCVLFSDIVDVTVAEPLSAHIGSVAKSYPDIPSGKMNIVGFSGGVYPYDVKIDLDSAASFSMPYHATEFEEAGLNSNQQIEMAYTEVPAGRYQVQVKDANGCVLDLIARVPLDGDLFVPNVFTPNGDGSNDILFIRNLPLEAGANQLVITNRWGKEVYSADDYKNNWDGTGAVDGIYFYRLQLAGSESITGWIEIIRGPKP